MDDQDVLRSIEQLIDREHRLRGSGGSGEAHVDRRELAALEVQLDQCWDLLRQRRAKRAVGEDPDQAAARSEAVVEHYWQ